MFPRDGQPSAEVTPVNRLRLDDLDAIADAAIGGMGLAWLPRCLTRERIQASTLVPLLPDQPGFFWVSHALWLQTPHLPLKACLAVGGCIAQVHELKGGASR